MSRYSELALHLILSLAAVLSQASSQDPECHTVFPSQYAYKTSALQNPTVDDDSNCSASTIEGVEYTFCAHPIRVTDNFLGPNEYRSDDNSYYLWNRDENCQVLFTFPEEVALIMVQFHYYIHRNESIGLPKLRVSMVGDDFQVSDTLDPSVTSLTVDPVSVPAELNERRVSSLPLSGDSTRQVLLRIDLNKRFGLALTEIQFCTEAPTGLPESTTTSSSSNSSETISVATPTSLTTATTIGVRTSSEFLSEDSTSGQIILHTSLLSLLSISTLVLVVLLVLR